MTIKILPPQLANQIAAGEVVERPASVVKELVENALDAGALHIDIEIDKGGHKRILIRDNGKGVDKEQLTLALSRHATSKISDIDDLEAIASLGFRGEALASISSVARLTMTSKPAQQNEAWSAIAEGLGMDVKVMPAAHPNGTSVEVLDLFFNTPARRKFLRAEKTEFGHIETLIKRIALSRPDVGFVLKHNGKTMKRFRAQKNDLTDLEQKSNRVADVINKTFIEQSSVVRCVYDDIEISVWAKSPQMCTSVNPAQYSFVNGRMMRDKLIQHAIRQAYGQKLQSEQLPEYVIFIDLPATDVDVNVHPAKHEVRFHHSRLLHDLLIKTIQDALSAFEAQQSLDSEVGNDRNEEQKGYQVESLDKGIKVEEPFNGNPDTSVDQRQPDWLVTSNQLAVDETNNTDSLSYKQPLRQRDSQTFSGLTSKSQNQRKIDFTPINRTIDHLKLNQAIEQSIDSTALETKHATNEQAPKLLFLQNNQYAYFEFQQRLWLISLTQLFAKTEVTTAPDESSQDFSDKFADKFATTPLLVPVRLKLSADEKQWVMLHEELLVAHGFGLKLHQQFLIVKQVPNILRRNNSGEALPSLFARLMTQSQSKDSLIAAILNTNSIKFSAQQVQAQLNSLSQGDDFKSYLGQNTVELNAEQILEYN